MVEAASAVGFKNMVIETHPCMLEFLRYYEQAQTFYLNFYLQEQQEDVQLFRNSLEHGFVASCLQVMW